MPEIHVPKALPEYNVTHFHAFKREHPDTIEADLSLLLDNQYMIKFPVPPLALVVFVPNCVPEMDLITVAKVEISAFQASPRKPLAIDTKSTITDIADELSASCLESDKSPLDRFMESVLGGNMTTIYAYPDVAHLPPWISDLTQNMGPIPIPFLPPNRDRLDLNPIRNFTLDHVSIAFPAPSLVSQNIETQPRLSCSISAIIDLPDGLDLPLDIPRVRSIAYVSYQGKEFGYLQGQKWQNATMAWKNRFSSFELRFNIHEAPLVITSEEVFGRMARKYIFTTRPITLGVRAFVDTQIAFSERLGITIRRIPAKTQVVLHRK